MKIRVPRHILSIEPYEPGKPLEELEREYGLRDSIKLASNENPIGPSPLAVAAVRDSLENLHRYPDGGGFVLTARLAEKLGVSPERIVLGNGSDDLIGMLTRSLLQPDDEVLVAQPSFLMYEIMARSAGARPVFVPLKNLGLDPDAMLTAVTDRTRMVFICNPNNPTGSVLSQKRFERFLDRLPDGIVVVVDEAYIEFVRDPECLQSLRLAEGRNPIVTLRTFSKAYGLAGLRIGYGVMPESLAQLLHRVRSPFNASSPAQAGATAALGDEAFLAETLKTVHDGIDFLYDQLKRRGIRYFPTQTNFLLIDVEQDAQQVFEAMLRRGIIIRSMKAYGYPRYIRISVGLPEENKRFVDALEETLSAA